MAHDGIKIELVYSNFGAIGERMIRDADRIVDVTAHKVVGHAVILLDSPPKSGRVYKRGNVEHQASAPGEAPATDIGNLSASGRVVDVGLARRDVEFTAEYARPLEYGAPTRNLLPRPFLRPAVERFRQTFFQALDYLLKHARGGDDIAAGDS